MPARTSLTIGVLGTGATSRKQAASAVSDLIKGGRAKFVFPVTTTHFSDAVKAVADFARRNDYPYEVIVDDTTDDVEDTEDLLDEATKTHKVTKVPRKLVALVAAAGEKGHLALAWDDEDRDCAESMELAVDKGITPLDLTQGMEPLKYDEDAEDSAETDDEPAGTAEDEDLDEPRVVTSGPVELTATAEPEDEPEPVQDEAEADADEAQAHLPLPDTRKVMFGAAGLLEAVLEEVRRIVREEVTEATKPRPRGRPRKDGKPAGSGS